MKKRVGAFVLSAVVLTGVFAAPAFAEDETENFENAEAEAVKPVNIFLDYNYISLGSRAMMTDDSVIAPVDEICGLLGLNCRFDETWNSVCVWLENKYTAARREVLFNLDSAFTTILGEEQYVQVPTARIDGVVYVQLRPLAEAFGSEVTFFDEGDHYDVNLSKSVAKTEIEAAEEAEERALAKVSGIKSQTDYLVYVSKPEYRVRVYLKSDGGWCFLKSFECAVGAPDTPTVEGEFTYYKNESMWDYGSYYVGPVMRFYYGYALHSTLLYKDGKPYDNRVGAEISHGCVRLKKSDIEWLSYYVPLKTKIYIA